MFNQEGSAAAEPNEKIANHQIDYERKGAYPFSTDWDCETCIAIKSKSGVMGGKYSTQFTGTKVSDYSCSCRAPNGDFVNVELYDVLSTNIVEDNYGNVSYGVYGQRDISSKFPDGSNRLESKFDTFSISSGNYNNFNHYGGQNMMGETLKYIFENKYFD